MNQRPNFIGTEAAQLPDAVFGSISDACPGAAGIALRACPVKDQTRLLRYLAGPPPGPDD